MTELVFILDRSGSMAGLEADTIGGFNSMIAKQKKEAGEALVSTVLFDRDSTVIHDRLPLEKVPPMTEKDYFARGCTALLDAVGEAIHHIGNVHKYARREDVPEKTLFLLPLLGGSVGALLGMRVFHHKTKHWYFVWGVPAILLAQLALAVWLLTR